MEIMNKTIVAGQLKKESHTGKLLGMLFVLSIIGAAFYFSAQPASISKLQSGTILNVFESFGFENITMHFVRKLAHFVLFATLGVAFTFAFSFKFTGIKLATFSYLSATLMAILDETHQMFVPGRGPQVKDVILDSVGALFGIVLMTLGILLYKKLKKAYRSSL
ncbi:MAG: VanZ family protein [Clostridia bacterium]|nr:VanZ family protein [Clostridia bacterium]